MDWHIEQFYLKIIHPLCNILGKSITYFSADSLHCTFKLNSQEGVEISCGSVQCPNPLLLILSCEDERLISSASPPLLLHCYMMYTLSNLTGMH